MANIQLQGPPKIIENNFSIGRIFQWMLYVPVTSSVQVGRSNESSIGIGIVST